MNRFTFLSKFFLGNCINTWLLFPPSASDLVMKVDALLSAAPKGEVRRDVHFIKEEYRWVSFLSFFFFYCSLALNDHNSAFRPSLLLNPLFSSSVSSSSLPVRTRSSMMLWPLLIRSQERHRRYLLCWLWAARLLFSSYWFLMKEFCMKGGAEKA